MVYNNTVSVGSLRVILNSRVPLSKSIVNAQAHTLSRIKNNKNFCKGLIQPQTQNQKISTEKSNGNCSKFQDSKIWFFP